MTPETPSHSVTSSDPVALSLFDMVFKYAKALKDGSVDVDKPLSDTTPIIVFCQNFFLQFFDNVLHAPLVTIDTQAKEEAAKIRASLQEDQSAAPVRRLVAVFEQLCDEWPEVRGLSYVGLLRRALLEFHRGFLPDFFNAITSWANTLKNPALAKLAEDAETAYATGLAALIARLKT